ncbi:MAG TPA: translation initiation factor IF-6 [Thermoprotei archaeon]|nr:translation initiation factor IF-6 [Thermoprotei archaeon]
MRKRQKGKGLQVSLLHRAISTVGVTRGRLMGSNWVGVKVFANDKVALVSPSFDEKSLSLVKSALGVETLPVDVISSELHGVMIAGNNKGVLFPWNVDDDDLLEVKKSYDLNVGQLQTNYTALGNLILANSFFALVYEGFDRETVRQISDVLGVEVERGRIGQYTTVGSLAVVTDRGLALPPSVSDEEAKELEQKFKVRGDTATVNIGFNYLRLGLVANSFGALAGEASTGPELVSIERALALNQQRGLPSLGLSLSSRFITNELRATTSHLRGKRKSGRWVLRPCFRKIRGGNQRKTCH